MSKRYSRYVEDEINAPMTSSCPEREVSRVMRKPAFCIYAKTKTQISFAVTAKLISAFVFATGIEQSLYFLNTKFQGSSHLRWLYSQVFVRPGLKPEDRFFSERR